MNCLDDRWQDNCGPHMAIGLLLPIWLRSAISANHCLCTPPYATDRDLKIGGYKDNILAKFWYIYVRNGVYRLAAPINIVF